LINQFFDPVLSFKLWSRVKHFMPNVQGLAAAGLNEHLRFLRYGEAPLLPGWLHDEPMNMWLCCTVACAHTGLLQPCCVQGHYFAPHQDGENRKDCGRSVFSALLHLGHLGSLFAAS
jgi:hypothetical protein